MEAAIPGHIGSKLGFDPPEQEETKDPVLPEQQKEDEVQTEDPSNPPNDDPLPVKKARHASTTKRKNRRKKPAKSLKEVANNEVENIAKPQIEESLTPEAPTTEKTSKRAIDTEIEEQMEEVSTLDTPNTPPADSKLGSFLSKDDAAFSHQDRPQPSSFRKALIKSEKASKQARTDYLDDLSKKTQEFLRGVREDRIRKENERKETTRKFLNDLNN